MNEIKRYYEAVSEVRDGHYARFSFRADSKELAYDHAQHVFGDLKVGSVKFLGTVEPENCGQIQWDN